MKQNRKILLSLLAALSMMVQTNLYALAPEKGEEGQVQLQVGKSRLSFEEEVKIQEERWERAEEETKGNVDLFVSVEEETYEKALPLENDLVTRNIEPKQAASVIARNVASTNFTNYNIHHPGAYHYPYAVSPFGDCVELLDASIWTIKTSDRDYTLNWLTSDIILVTQNHEFFSYYKYKLINQNTGAQVRANLTPFYSNAYTYWIDGIDYGRRLVYLSDGSRWNVSMWDAAQLNKWAPHDTVIIGVNSGFGKVFNPHILINVEVNNYVEVECK